MAASSNTLITPTIIAKEALMQLKNNLVMGELVFRDYTKEFVKVGSTISIRKPVKFKASTGASRVSSDVIEGTVPLAIDTQKHVSWDFVSSDLTLTIENYSERYIKPAMIELAQQVETSLMGLYKTVPGWVGTAGTTPSTFLAVGAARQYLMEHAAPMGEPLAGVINPAAALQIANDLKSQFQPEKQLRAMERVRVGKYAGLDLYEAQSIVNHTVGPLGGTPLINGANQQGRSLTTRGWTPGLSGALKAGDFIGIAGQTKVYMVTADVTADAFGLATVPIEPGLLAVPADGAVMTLRNVPFTVALGADTMESVVLQLLRERGLTLGLAESVTGGLVAGRITNVPGSSDVLRGGVVSAA